MTDFMPIIIKCQTSMEAVLDLAERGHGALIVVLADAFRALLEIRKDEAGFAEFAKIELGAKVTGASVDATCLLLIKVIFHGVSAKFDFRRQFNQMCLAVLYVEQQQVPVEHAAQFIRDVGGMVACANAYRKANSRNSIERQQVETRRVDHYLGNLPKIGTTTAFADGEQVTTINTAKDQRTLEALAQQPGRVLLLGEIDEDFNLKIIGVVERDAAEVARFLARKARAAMPIASYQNVSTMPTGAGANDNMMMNEAV